MCTNMSIYRLRCANIYTRVGTQGMRYAGCEWFESQRLDGVSPIIGKAGKKVVKKAVEVAKKVLKKAVEAAEKPVKWVAKTVKATKRFNLVSQI